MSNKCALLYESDPLVGERLRQMVREEGFATVLVDDPATFLSVRGSMTFDLYVVGVRGPDQLGFLGSDKIEPLVLVAPIDDAYASAPYRIALPAAIVVDRALRDVDAIRQALRGRDPSGHDARRPRQATAIETAFAPFGLSERQLEVLRCALLGQTSREIAAHLFISELTVRNHLHAIYERVGVSGRRELLGRFVQGLMEGTSFGPRAASGTPEGSGARDS